MTIKEALQQIQQVAKALNMNVTLFQDSEDPTAVAGIIIGYQGYIDWVLGEDIDSHTPLQPTDQEVN